MNGSCAVNGKYVGNSFESLVYNGCVFVPRLCYGKIVVPGAGIEPARLAAGDFESPASTNFTTRA